MSSFGDELKAIRTELGITMVQLQKNSGVSQSYISQLENGKRQPTREVISNLIKGLIYSNKDSINQEEIIKRLNQAEKKDSLTNINVDSQKLIEQIDKSVADKETVKLVKDYAISVSAEMQKKIEYYLEPQIEIPLEDILHSMPKYIFTISGESLSHDEKEALKIFIKGIKANRP